MKITLELNEELLCAFVCGVELTYNGLQMVSHQLSSDDLVDGNTIKLPREERGYAKK